MTQSSMPSLALFLSRDQKRIATMSGLTTQKTTAGIWIEGAFEGTEVDEVIVNTLTTLKKDVCWASVKKPR